MINPTEYLFCEEDVANLQNCFCQSGWITLLYESPRENGGGKHVFCALVDDSEITKALDSYQWDLLCSDYSTRIDESNNNFLGFREVPKPGYQQLVQIIPPKGKREVEYFICDDFRLVYQLFRKDVNGRVSYMQLDEAGAIENEIVIIENNTVRARVKYIKEYLAIRNLNLLLFIDTMPYCDKSYEELGFSPKHNLIVKDSDLVFNYSNIHNSCFGNHKSGAWLVGKCALRHNTKDIQHLWSPFEGGFENFIIGCDNDGNEITWTCDENKLSNLFTPIAGLPICLTPIFFKLDVLKEYKANPSLYKITDGAIYGPEWTLKVDNDRNDGLIVATLVDLGKLPHSVQRHWKLYNIARPLNSGLSETTFKRWFLGEACDPSCAPDHVFKRVFVQVNKYWSKKYGWPLFKPLAPGDEHYWEDIQCMSDDDNEKVFDEEILAITKVVVDSLNEKKLVEHLDNTKKEIIENYLKKHNTEKTSNLKGGISKFELFLLSHDLKNELLVKHLRSIQELRSIYSAHRKSTSPDKSKMSCLEYFGIDKDSQRVCLNNLLMNLSNYLEDLMV